MDPNAAWNEILEFANTKYATLGNADMQRAVELCESLGNWLRHGGFLPLAAEAAGLNRTGVCRICTALMEYAGARLNRFA